MRCGRGSRQLTLNSDSSILVKYEFVASEAGTYTLRVREYYPTGRFPLRWRVDAGEWHAVKQGWDLVQTQMENSMVYSEWGQVELTLYSTNPSGAWQAGVAIVVCAAGAMQPGPGRR